MKQKATSKKSGSESLPECEIRIHPHLTTYIGYCLHKVALRMRAALDQRVSKFGLVSPQYGMLIILKTEGPISQHELGSYMAADKATMVRMIDGLESKKYLKRKPSEKDRREKLVEITPAGLKVIGELEKVRGQAEKEFLAPLNSEEKLQLKDIVMKLMR